MKKYIILVLLMIVSGYISNFSLGSHPLPFSGGMTPYLPGIIFGLLVGGWFLIIEKTKLIKTIMWWIFSILAYWAAFNTYLAISSHSVASVGDPNAFGFFIAGVVGSFILTIGTILFIAELNLKQIFVGSTIRRNRRIIFYGDNAIRFELYYLATSNRNYSWYCG